MNQNKYQPVSTIKLSAKGNFEWVKCPSANNPDRTSLLQSYPTRTAAEFLEPVQWEVDRLLPLSHPHLQSVIDVFTTVDGLHIVQELEQWNCAAHQAPYSPVRAKILLQEIIPVLLYLHDRGITHGNISPDTIVVNERNQHILTNFSVITDLIAKVGGDTYPRLRAQLEQIPVVNLPTGREWDVYSLGVTTIALLTNKDYQELYDPINKRWQWANYVDCSEELTRTIDRLLGQEKQSLKVTLDAPRSEIITPDRRTVDRQFSEPTPTSLTRVKLNYYRQIISLLTLGILGLLGYLIWDKFQPKLIATDRLNAEPQQFPPNGTLTVGYLDLSPARSRPQSLRRDYPKLQSYLETELRKKYGDRVLVKLDSAITNREAQTKIEQKQWDLAFSFLATHALAAEDNKYEFIARMSANNDPYRDVCFFVRKNSKINSIKDFTPDRTIALPSDDSPLFVMPFYDLYGKRMRVNIGNNLSSIQDKVKSGEADVGVHFCKTIAKIPDFRNLSPNRIIPVGGVFLSPKIDNPADREYVKELFAKAPKDIQSKANYTLRPIVNYTRFRRINDRANELLNCVDFTRNPVNFYCK
jgi:serine/threonine-protein kinase